MPETTPGAPAKPIVAAATRRVGKLGNLTNSLLGARPKKEASQVTIKPQPTKY